MLIPLRIFNFPPLLTNVDVREFLHLFGLQADRIFRRRTSHGAIVNVCNESEARLVIARLHQLLMNSYRLKVEYCDKDDYFEESLLIGSKEEAKRKVSDVNQVERVTLNYKEFPPPYILYRYPGQSPSILSNISSELASNPSFYYQVLHLMNKMNLKAPFRDPQPENQASISGRFVYASSNEESELESDDGTNNIKRIKPDPNRRTLQRTMKVLNYEQTPQTVAKQRSKPPVIDIHIAAESFITAQSLNEVLSCVPDDTYKPAVKTSESDPEKLISATLEDILLNRIPEEQRNTLNVFQNYTVGEPTNKLYIKNLAKTVTEQDLQQIVSIFNEKDSHIEINVKLMKTGRMKGQAFITFLATNGDPSSVSSELEKCVARTLSSMNGYILKNKPMVVSYAKKS